MRRLVALSKWANHKLGLDKPPVEGEIAETQTKVPPDTVLAHSLNLTVFSSLYMWIPVMPSRHDVAHQCCTCSQNYSDQ